MKLKQLALGGLVASTLPFFVSQSYTLYYLARHHDDPGMTEAKATHILHCHFPGKQLLWVCDLVATFWVLPIVFLLSFVKNRPKTAKRKVKTRVVYTGPYNELDPTLKAQVDQMIANLSLSPRWDGGDFGAKATWDRYMQNRLVGQ